jgi:copper chaperone
MSIGRARRYFLPCRDEIPSEGVDPKGVEMTAMHIEIDNLKCGGCARSILKGLADVPGISGVDVDLDQQQVRFTGEASTRSQVADKLRSMGYPEKGSLQGLNAGLANAKSFVSCAIGRVS